MNLKRRFELLKFSEEYLETIATVPNHAERAEAQACLEIRREIAQLDINLLFRYAVTISYGFLSNGPTGLKLKMHREVIFENWDTIFGKDNEENEKNFRRHLLKIAKKNHWHNVSVEKIEAVYPEHERELSLLTPSEYLQLWISQTGGGAK